MKKLHLILILMSVAMMMVAAIVALAIAFPPTVTVVSITQVQTNYHVTPAYTALGVGAAGFAFLGSMVLVVYEEPQHVAE